MTIQCETVSHALKFARIFDTIGLFLIFTQRFILSGGCCTHIQWDMNVHHYIVVANAFSCFHKDIEYNISI